MSYQVSKITNRVSKHPEYYLYQMNTSHQWLRRYTTPCRVLLFGLEISVRDVRISGLTAVERIATDLSYNVLQSRRRLEQWFEDPLYKGAFLLSSDMAGVDTNAGKAHLVSPS